MPNKNTKTFFLVAVAVMTGGILLASEARGIFAQVISGEDASSSAQSLGAQSSSNAQSEISSAAPAEDSAASSVSGIDTGEAVASSADAASSVASSTASSADASADAQSSVATSSESASSESASSESASSVSSVAESASASSAAEATMIRGTIVTSAHTGMLGNSWVQFSVPRGNGMTSADDVQTELRITLTAEDGTVIQPDSSVEERGNAFIVTVLPPSSFRPGTYRLHVEARPGAFGRLFESLFGKGEDPAIVEGDVELGTVAINTDQGTYAAGEDVVVTQASLDADGVLRCADTFTASFAGTVRQTLEPACSNGSLTLSMPDVSSALTATLTGGSWIQEQARTVSLRNASDMGVRRTAATAVSAGDTGTMEIVVTLAQELRGTVREMVPPGFTVSNVVPFGDVQTVGEDGTQITWDGQWAAGTRTFTYTYTAPQEQPTMGLFGPLTVRAEFTGVAEPTAPSAASSSVDASASSAETSESSESSEAASSVESSAASSEVPDTSVESDGTSSADSSAPAEEIIIPVIPVDEAQGDNAANDEVSFWGAFSNAVASLFGNQSLTAAITVDGTTLSFIEDARWQMLVAKGSTSADTRDRTLTFDRTAAVFAADATPSFRLVETDLSQEENITDSGNRLKTDVAMREVLHAVIADEDIQNAALQEVLRTRADVIAQQTASALVDRATGVSERGVEFAVESALTDSSEARETIVDVLADKAVVQKAAEQLAGDAVREEVIGRLADVIAETPGEPVSTETIEAIVTQSTDERLEAQDAAADAIADAAKFDANARQALRDVATDGVAASQPAAETASPLLQLQLVGPDGKNIENPPFHFLEGSVELAIDPLPAFQPGLYTLTVIVTNPLTGEQETFTQQFVWGVLAVNADKDIYDVNETAFLSFGVLDDKGEIVCDADLTLQITRPDGTVQVLNSEDQTVLTTGTCGRKEAGFIQPDYVAVLPVQQEGEYTLRLTATFAGKERSIATELHVQPDAPFSITRKSATRLWPFAPAPMVITVRFHTDLAGTITDTVPPGFIISDILPFGITYQDEDGTTHVRWEGAWNAGETISFRYYYDAPDISPHFYLIGPLEIGSDEPFTGSTPTHISPAPSSIQ